jgi:hypothetical protein
MRHLLTVLGVLLLAGCGGDAKEPAAGKDADPARSAAEAVTAGTSTPLALSDAERVGFAREQEKEFTIVGATDGAGGTLEGDRVEIYVYDGAPPADQVEGFRRMAASGMGWTSVCEVGNLVMLYKDEAACQVLRTLER